MIKSINQEPQVTYQSLVSNPSLYQYVLKRQEIHSEQVIQLANKLKEVYQ